MEQICTFIFLFSIGMFIVFNNQNFYQKENKTKLPSGEEVNTKPSNLNYNV